VAKAEIPVVGIAHRVTLPTSKKIAAAVPISAKLIREPDNKHDENAIKIVLTEAPFKTMHLGYLPRGMAEKLAPRVDAGRIRFVDAAVIEVDPELGTGTVEVEYRKVKRKKA
jgi:hypothetical protein